MTEVWAPELLRPRWQQETRVTPEVDAGSLTPGTQLDERYGLVRPIGCGGMGQVYEARHLRLGRRVAVKLLRALPGSADAVRRRFEQEARAAAQIEHERVVTVFDFGIAPNRQPYLVMEYLEGKDLRRLLREEGSLAAPRAVGLLRDVCFGLEAAHARNVIHRDIKPENLFVVRDSNGKEACKVLDFGLAKLRASGASDLHTVSGLPLGTLHYMSPEQARGEADVDERTDVYGCAAVLYELLSGQKPHVADSPHALLYKITNEPVRRIEEHGAWLPGGLADVIHRGLEAERALRPMSIQVFRKLLEPFLAKSAAAVPISTTRDRVDTVGAEHEVDSRPATSGRARSAATGRGRRAATLLLTAVVASAASWFAAARPSETSPLPERAASPCGAAAAVPAPEVPPAPSALPPQHLEAAPSAAPSVRTAAASSPPPRRDTVPQRVEATASEPTLDDARFDRRNPYE